MEWQKRDDQEPAAQSDVEGKLIATSRNVIVTTPAVYVHVTFVPSPRSHVSPFIDPSAGVSVAPSHEPGAPMWPFPSAVSVSVALNVDVVIVAFCSGLALKPFMSVLKPITEYVPARSAATMRALE